MARYEEAAIEIADFGGEPPVIPIYLRERVGQTISDSRAPATRRANGSRFAIFERFCAEFGLSALPARPETVAAYIEWLDERGKAMSTIQAYVSAVSGAHAAAGLPNPCKFEGARLVMAGKRRQRAGERRRQARALSDLELQAIMMSLAAPRLAPGGVLETQEAARKRADRDLALLLVMTQAGLRRSEAERLRWGDASMEADGSGRIFVRMSKTDQSGAGAVVAIKPDGAAALWKIRADDADDDAPVFGVGGQQIDRRLKAMCAAAGVGIEGISGHTPRVTLARRMSERGAPSHIIQRQGRWASPGMVALYTRNAQAAESLRWL